MLDYKDIIIKHYVLHMSGYNVTVKKREREINLALKKNELTIVISSEISIYTHGK